MTSILKFCTSACELWIRDLICRRSQFSSHALGISLIPAVSSWLVLLIYKHFWRAVKNSLWTKANFNCWKVQKWPPFEQRSLKKLKSQLQVEIRKERAIHYSRHLHRSKNGSFFIIKNSKVLVIMPSTPLPYLWVILKWVLIAYLRPQSRYDVFSRSTSSLFISCGLSLTSTYLKYHSERLLTLK